MSQRDINPPVERATNWEGDEGRVKAAAAGAPWRAHTRPLEAVRLEEMSGQSQCGSDSESTSLDNLTRGSQEGTDLEEVLSESTDKELIRAPSDESKDVPEATHRVLGAGAELAQTIL